jgi:hypothetical protein
MNVTENQIVRAFRMHDSPGMGTSTTSTVYFVEKSRFKTRGVSYLQLLHASIRAEGMPQNSVNVARPQSSVKQKSATFSAWYCIRHRILSKMLNFKGE